MNNLFRYLTLTFIQLITCSTLIAQVVNTEKLRLQTQQKSFIGNIDVSFRLSQNNAGQSINLHLDSHFDYTKNRSKWMLLAGYNRVAFARNNSNNNYTVINHFQFAHLRYNYQWADKLTWEAFVQEQFDQVHEIDIRYLTGTGPRWKILQNDTAQAYLGIIYMYEYEVNSPNDITVYNSDHRISTYFSAGYKWKKYIDLHSIIYYQPNLAAFNDFRLLLETRLSTQITKQLSWKTVLHLIYDSRPPETIPTMRYLITNGIGFRF